MLKWGRDEGDEGEQEGDGEGMEGEGLCILLLRFG